jgi:hypothetical protein
VCTDRSLGVGDYRESCHRSVCGRESSQTDDQIQLITTGIHVRINHMYYRRSRITRYLLVLIAAVFMTSVVEAQIRVNLNFNFDRQPMWGPTGYDHVEYYYLPDIEVYYNVPQRRFFYFERGRWIGGSSLPSRYRGYDLYRSYKVVVNDPTPYRNHETYRVKYSTYKGQHDQQPIRDSRDSRYFVNKNHPEHNNWIKEQERDNGNGKEKGRGSKSGQNRRKD